MKLVIATGNAGKLEEFRQLLGDPGLELMSLADFPEIDDIEENGATFEENALIKARTVTGLTGLVALADDSGLMVNALGGLPGVKSARFAPTTAERNRKLLDMLENVPDGDRTARFVCSLALVRPDGFEWTTTGTCVGIIVREPAGDGGFGYDPLFFYEPFGATFAEIPREQKNTISHRGKALAAFKEAIEISRILEF